MKASMIAVIGTLALGVAQQSAIYKDSNAPIEKRIDDLISRMTLEEKVSQLMNDSPAIERLGIPAYNWWNECLHGVARAGLATVFPEAIGLAATWDTDLQFRVATAISDEARAKHHAAVRRGERNIYQGLTFWTPNINLFRDPRWGRGMETYGEDPYLTARMAVAFIRGLQGDDPKYLKTIATAKHYAVHSGPESARHTFDAVIDDRDLFDTYLPQFEAAIKEGGAQSVMCAYNSVDGQPACASSRLLDGILRKQWGFQGYIVSDCGAIEDIFKTHKFAPDAEHAVAASIQAGTDLDCGVEYSHVTAAVRAGLVAESEVNTSLRRLLWARFKLGLFDPPAQVRYARIPYSENDSPAHRQLAIEAARKSIILLKNDSQVLPLSKKLQKIAVIGPNADDRDSLLGNYNGIPAAPVTLLEGIRRKAGRDVQVSYARGSDLAANLPHFEVVPTSALSTSNGSGGRPGLKGEYFNTSNFDGRPHRPRELTYPNSGQLVRQASVSSQPVFTRVDPRIDFEWWDGAPRRDLNANDFGVRWTGFISAPASGTYELGAIGMNAFELYFEAQPLVSFNGVHESAYRSAAVRMESGKRYQIRLDYHEYVNDASIQLVWSREETGLLTQAVQAANQADAVVLVLGLSPRLEGEEMNVPVEGFQGGDRVTTDLPRIQQQLMEKIVALGKPVVLVLMNGSSLSVNWARDHVPAILEAWYPGQAGGTAVADVLFGDYNPAGRLPVTFYRSMDQLPPFTDYHIQGRTYRYFEGEPLFRFGFGLSYTNFAYQNLRLPKAVNTGDDIGIAFDVENTGAVAGEEVAQLYVEHLSASAPAPIRSLQGFQRFALGPKERKTVRFTLSARQVALVTASGHRVVEPGTLRISVGGQQPGAAGVIAENIRIGGTAKELP